MSTETDREFLCWLHERLQHVHGEHPLVGYMHRLRAIIADIPKDQVTPTKGLNSLKDLREKWGDA